MENNKQGLFGRMDRRNMLKGLATVPFLGAFAIGWWRKRRKEHYIYCIIKSFIGFNRFAHIMETNTFIGKN